MEKINVFGIAKWQYCLVYQFLNIWVCPIYVAHPKSKLVILLTQYVKPIEVVIEEFLHFLLTVFSNAIFYYIVYPTVILSIWFIWTI